MVVLSKTRRETPRPSLTDLLTREWSPLSDSEASSASSHLDFIYRTPSPRQNSNGRSVANSEDDDQRVPEIDERTSSPHSDIIRNQETEIVTEILNYLNIGPFSFANIGSTSESSNNHATECQPQVPSSSPSSSNDGSDEIFRAFRNIRLDDVCPSSVRDIPEFQYYPHTFRPGRLTFRQVIYVMKNFYFVPCVNISKIRKRTIRAFSLLIYGIPPEYIIDDLPWVVFLFIKQYFGVQAEFEFCKRNLPKLKDPNVIGVVFKDANVRYDLLLERRKLEGTRYRMEPNEDLSWIIDLCRSQSWN